MTDCARGEKMNPKLEALRQAIHDLEGVEIPYNIIKQNIAPLQKWLDEDEEKNKKICRNIHEQIYRGCTELCPLFSICEAK